MCEHSKNTIREVEAQRGEGWQAAQTLELVMTWRKCVYRWRFLLWRQTSSAQPPMTQQRQLRTPATIRQISSGVGSARITPRHATPHPVRPDGSPKGGRAGSGAANGIYRRRTGGNRMCSRTGGRRRVSERSRGSCDCVPSRQSCRCGPPRTHRKPCCSSRGTWPRTSRCPGGPRGDRTYWGPSSFVDWRSKGR